MKLLLDAHTHFRRRPGAPHLLSDTAINSSSLRVYNVRFAYAGWVQFTAFISRRPMPAVAVGLMSFVRAISSYPRDRC